MKNLKSLNSPTTEPNHYRTHVPLTIIGEYYLTAEDTAGKSLKPIHASPYCYPRPKRSHPDLSLKENVAARRGGLSVVIPQAGHKLVEKVDKLTASKFTVSHQSWYQYSQCNTLMASEIITQNYIWACLSFCMV